MPMAEWLCICDVVDFDEHLESLKYGHDAEVVSKVAARLKRMEQEATASMFTNDWPETEGDNAAAPWWRGVPDVYGNIDGQCGGGGGRGEAGGSSSSSSCNEVSTEALGEAINPRATDYLMALWCWRLVKSYDLLEYCRERIYSGLVKNGARWDDLADADADADGSKNSTSNYSSKIASMNDWGPGTNLGETTESDWRKAFSSSFAAPAGAGAGGGGIGIHYAIPQARQDHLITVLHEARELLEPGSTHPLPPHAYDQPDTPWPEREDESAVAAAAAAAAVHPVGVLLTTMMILAAAAAATTQRRKHVNVAAVDTCSEHTPIREKTTKTLRNSNASGGKRGGRRRLSSSSPSTSPSPAAPGARGRKSAVVAAGRSKAKRS